MSSTDTNFSPEKIFEVQSKALEIILHDAKNLLSNINLASELLLLEEFNDHERQRLISLIHNSGREMERLLNGHSVLMQIERGVYKPQFKILDVIQTVEAQIEEHHNLIKEKKLEVNMSSDKEKALINTDWFCLNAALRNIFRNALQASPECAQIKIDLHSNEQFQINIHNNGAVPDEVRAQFFKRYVTIKSRREGVGLGTYIAKKMIDVLNGTISFKSSEKHGTTVSIQLPADIMV